MNLSDLQSIVHFRLVNVAVSGFFTVPSGGDQQHGEAGQP